MKRLENIFLLDKKNQKDHLFPYVPGEEIPQESLLRENDPLFQIYERISLHYTMGDWSLEDFQCFRKALASIREEDFARYHEVIFFFLRLDRTMGELWIRDLAKHYEFPLFEQRVAKKIQDETTGQKGKTIYVSEEKPYDVGDIVRFAKALDGKIRSFSCSVLSLHPEFRETDNDFERLSILKKIYNEDLNENPKPGKPLGKDVPILYEQFDAMFSSYLPVGIQSYLEERKNDLISHQKDYLYQQLRTYEGKTATYAKYACATAIQKKKIHTNEVPRVFGAWAHD